jgi:hypothetical protein
MSTASLLLYSGEALLIATAEFYLENQELNNGEAITRLQLVQSSNKDLYKSALRSLNLLVVALPGWEVRQRGGCLVIGGCSQQCNRFSRICCSSTLSCIPRLEWSGLVQLPLITYTLQCTYLCDKFRL